ncbi:MAG: type II toxin-antitoxin system HicB family antitoxin [Methanosarcinaceae archaeon]|nr:type II toxin-antitoxin system HicB family antitoxin [Methanosarcinaceae archaeon]
MGQTQKFSAMVHKEDDWYVSWCPDIDIASQGKTVEEAVANLKEAVELYLEDEDVSVTQTISFLTTFEVSHAKTSHHVSE